MKIAVTGKGGAGKTTVAAILARALARDGHRVVALDADPNPNLGIALGLGVERTAALDGAINQALRERAHDHGSDHEHAPKPPEQVLTEIGVEAPDGVLLAQTGRIERPADGCLCCGSHGTTRRMFGELPGEDTVVVADLEAGLNDLLWARPRDGDTVVIVAEPYVKSLAVATRARRVAEELGVQRIMLVANRVADAGDLDRIRTALPGLEPTVLPEDPALTAADRCGTAPLDSAGDAPAVRAVVELASRLGPPVPAA